MVSEIDSPSSVPFKENCPVPVEWLVLDRRNPRLISTDQEASDEKIIAQLFKGEELSELLQSISANGYLDIEPLIVMKIDDSALIVLEGNRRLAAIRLFREPELADCIFNKERIRITIPAIEDKNMKTLEKVSVYRVAERDEARSFIGFKHINGAAKWDSYAKGKFAADWYRSGDVTLEQIANRIGDRHDTIKRMVNAIFVLEQAEKGDIFHISDRVNPRFNFSHLYTALARAQYMEYLSLEAAWASFEPTPNPVPNDRQKNLGEVLRWIYGSKEEEIPPVIQSQNPDIKRLGEVLLDAEGLNVLRTGNKLSEAHASIQPAEDRFSEGLLKARSIIREVVNSLRGFDGRDTSLVNIAEDVVETSQIILERMRKKVRSIVDDD